MKTKTKILIVNVFTLVGSIIWLGLIFLAPYLKSQSSIWNRIIYAAFSPICHQIPSRCFKLFGYPLAVCTRCLGIYIGFFTGAGIYSFLKKGLSEFSVPQKKSFILVSFPIVIDTIGNFFSLWMTPAWIRFALGFIWGIILPFYFITGITDAFVIRKVKEKD